ncbi:hypothetical protein D3C86_1409130 [compost metagenome]
MHGVADDLRILLGHGPFHMVILHQADVFLAGAQGDLHAVDHDLLGGGGDSHQARGALPVQGLAAHAGGQAGRQCGHAAQVPAGGAGRHGGAHHQVFDFAGFDTGTLHGCANGVAGHARRFQVVERASKGFGDRRAGGGKDDSFTHFQMSCAG